MRERTSLRDEVYERLRDPIVRGTLVPGSRLLTTEVAAHLRVSRTPVREAIAKLAQDGLVVLERTGIAVVTATGAEDIAAFFELRMVLEGYAARQAALRGGEVGGRRLQKTCEDIARAIPGGDARRLIALNDRFHSTVLELAGNAAISPLLHSQQEVTLRDRLTEVYDVMDRAQSLQQHLAIAQAVLEGDAQRAGALAAHHVVEAAEPLLRTAGEGGAVSPALERLRQGAALFGLPHPGGIIQAHADD